MGTLPFNAPSLSTVVQGYDAWAEAYDREVRDLGYATPAAVAAAALQHLRHPAAHLLDVGAGTGLVGEKLARRGYRHLVGMDSSHGMLAQAARKGIYQLLCRMALGQPLGFPSHYFDGLLAAGVFTPGHAPPETLFELDRLVRPGGVIIFSLKWDGIFKKEFLETIGQLEGAARWQRQSWSAVYSSWPRVDKHLKSRVLVYKTPRSERA